MPDRVLPAKFFLSCVVYSSVLAQCTVHSHPGFLRGNHAIETGEESSEKGLFSQSHFESSVQESSPGPARSDYPELELGLATFPYNDNVDIPPKTVMSFVERTGESSRAPPDPQAWEKHHVRFKKSRPNELHASDFLSSRQSSTFTTEQRHAYDPGFDQLGLSRKSGVHARKDFKTDVRTSHIHLECGNGLPGSNQHANHPNCLSISIRTTRLTHACREAQLKAPVYGDPIRLEMTEASANAYAFIGSKTDELEEGYYDVHFPKLSAVFFGKFKQAFHSSGNDESSFELSFRHDETLVRDRLQLFARKVWCLHSQFLEVLAITASHEMFVGAQKNLFNWLSEGILSPHGAGRKNDSPSSEISFFSWLHDQLSDYLRLKQHVAFCGLRQARGNLIKANIITQETKYMTHMAVEIIGTYYKTLDYDKWKQVFENDDEFIRLLCVIRWQHHTRNYSTYIDTVFVQLSKVIVFPWHRPLSSKETTIVALYLKNHCEKTVENLISDYLIPTPNIHHLQLVPPIGHRRKSRILTLNVIEEKKKKSLTRCRPRKQRALQA